MNKLLSLCLCVFSITVFGQQLKVVDITCEYKINPSAVETLHPALSWKLESTANNVVQVAYQILVADNIVDLSLNRGNIWDSKKIISNQSIQVKYNGSKLLSSKTYFWKVKIWDNKNVAAWSNVGHWQMGLLKASDWAGAKWIAYEKIADTNINVLPSDGLKDKFKGNNVLPVLRKSFKITKSVKKATIYISGLGHFELNLNGQKVGDHFLAPGWTKYDKEALYLSFDLTNKLKIGENVIGVMLGNGFYYIPPVSGRYRKLKVAFGYPKMMCKLLITYKDGTTATVNSDQSWKTSPSAITFSSIYGGEDYNANLLQVGWAKTGFNDKNWQQAILVDGPPLKSEKQEPVKVFENFMPKSINQHVSGDWVYDLGQNSSGIIQLKLSGKKGDTVRITPAEILKHDGAVNQKPIGSPFYFTYILKGDGIETWQPKFTYYGFRYLQVKGAVPNDNKNPLQKPIILELKGLHIRNAAAQVGSFTTSNELFNQTFRLINWGIKSNMVSVFTDCPQREKLGWLEQLHLMGSSVRYNYNAAPLFIKALQDMRNSQLENGLIPAIAPEYVKFEWGGDMFRDSPEWGSSSILLPWYVYQWYGDKNALVDNYQMMQRYINYLGTKANNHILSHGLGDWYDLGPKKPGVSQLTLKGVTATAIYYHDLVILQKIALLLGKNLDAAMYKDLAAKVRDSFNNKFFNPITKGYATGSQTANAMAIYMGLVTEVDKPYVLENLIKDIKSRNNSLTAGDIGYRYLLRVLEDEGRSDVIFDMNSRSDVPGYGMQIAKGATALTESWAALPTVSNNHFMLGHLMEWFYSGVAGIKQADDAIAFNKIIIFPQPVGNLTSAKGSYNSPYGTIATDWKKTDSSFDIAIKIPVNTTAVVYLPATATQKITELNNYSVKNLGFENGRAKIAIGSGVYSFKVQ